MDKQTPTLGECFQLLFKKHYENITYFKNEIEPGVFQLPND